MCVLRGGAYDLEQSAWGLALVRVLLRAAGVVDCVHSAPGPGAGAPLGVDARCRPGCEFEGALSIRTRVVGTVRGSLTS